ncbi:general substrate transporter, partial [Helicostylum pulchrum]
QVLVELHQVPANHPLVMEEYENIVTEIEFERSLGDRTFLELFQGTNRKRTLLASFISISTSFTGSIAIWYYAPQIFQSAGLDDTSTSIAATGGTGILSFITAFISLQYFIDRVGRRPLFLTGAFVMGSSMFVVGAMFHVYTIVDVDTSTVTITNPYVRNTIIAFLYVFVAAFQFSWGTASYVYPVEIFNMRTRAKGLAFTVGLHWVFSIMITYCVPLFIAHTVSGVYFFFGSCCCAFFIGCWFIPETKGKTLEEMEELFGAQ